MRAAANSASARVLVTGGTGFLGRHVVAGLVRQGRRVSVLARAEPAEPLPPGVEIARGDLRDADAVRAACARVDAVVHAGALSQPWGDAAEFRAVNVAGTAHVLAGCRAAGVRRLVHISSPSVAFTGRDQREIPDDAPFAAHSLCEYSRTKRAAEELVARSGVPAVVLRPKALFGPGDRTLLPRLVALAEQRQLRVVGDGANEVDLTYVENAADAICSALDSERALGRTFHVTNGEHVRLWDVVRTLLRGLDLDPELGRVPFRVAWTFAAALELRARVFGGEPRLTRYTVSVLARTQTYDIRGARAALGYAPRISVDEGVQRTLAAWRAEVARA